MGFIGFWTQRLMCVGGKQRQTAPEISFISQRVFGAVYVALACHRIDTATQRTKEFHSCGLTIVIVYRPSFIWYLSAVCRCANTTWACVCVCWCVPVSHAPPADCHRHVFIVHYYIYMYQCTIYIVHLFRFIPGCAQLFFSSLFCCCYFTSSSSSSCARFGRMSYTVAHTHTLPHNIGVRDALERTNAHEQIEREREKDRALYNNVRIIIIKYNINHNLLGVRVLLKF